MANIASGGGHWEMGAGGRPKWVIPGLASGGGGGGGTPAEPAGGGGTPAGGGGAPAGGGGGSGIPGNALDAIMQQFNNALATYIGKPGQGPGGFGAGLADWIRQNQDYLQQRFLEEYMRKQQGQPNLQAYTPQNWLAQFNPFVQYYMTPPQYRGNVGRMPAISTRALRV